MLTNSIIEKIETLSWIDAYIFQFYYFELKNNTLSLIPGKVGSSLHLNFLKKEAKENPLLADIYKEFEKKVQRLTFHTKATRLMKLAAQAVANGVTAKTHVPKKVQAAHPSLSGSLYKGLKGTTFSAPSTTSPYTKSEFEWYDHQRRPSPGIIHIQAHRIMLSSVVTKADVKFKWLTETLLEVAIRYPDMMNFPVQLCSLVTDDGGNQVFHDQHECVKGFEKNLANRREDDGFVHDKFNIPFDKPQDPRFVRVNKYAKGFDLLRANYVNGDNELCDFKILQIVTKEKNKEEHMEGNAGVSNTGITVGENLQSTTQTNNPFASPSMARQQQPAPTPYPEPSPVPNQAHSMPPPMSTREQQFQDELAKMQAQVQNALSLAAGADAQVRNASQAKEQADESAMQQLADQKQQMQQEFDRQKAAFERTALQQLEQEHQRMQAELEEGTTGILPASRECCTG
jgi:hypothetical protein